MAAREATSRLFLIRARLARLAALAAVRERPRRKWVEEGWEEWNKGGDKGGGKGGGDRDLRLCVGVRIADGVCNKEICAKDRACAGEA
jgi:hypothetical protein